MDATFSGSSLGGKKFKNIFSLCTSQIFTIALCLFFDMHFRWSISFLKHSQLHTMFHQNFTFDIFAQAERLIVG